jgi:ABC-type oligopeptide transport system substrate-binding subunit
MIMRKLKVSLFLFICSFFATLLFSNQLCSETYKYVDEKGTEVYVDDLSKVPEKYRNQVEVRKEKTEGPSEEVTPAASEGAGEESEDYLTRQMEELKRQEEEKAREEFEQSLATPVTISGNHVDQLRLPLTKRAEVRVTGGQTIRARLAELDYVKVGPYEAKKTHVLIILHQGSATPHDGLLGMNFLRGLEYSIDFENQVIRWKP